MKYDIAAKVIVDMGKKAILREFLGIEYEDVKLLEELPEETVSLRRSDFPLRVVLENGQEKIILLEIQTEFNKDFVLRLADYMIRFTLKYHLEVIPLALVLKPSSLANGFYKDERLTFKYEVTRLWEKQASDFMGKIYLYPFLPLANGGEKLIEDADTAIYESYEISREEKADLLTAMAIFAGLKDKKLGAWLIERRRDIMIESPIYDLIKEEGIKEGKKEGKKEGLYETLFFGIELKFGIDGIPLIEKVRKIDSIGKLESLKEAIRLAKNIEEFEKLI
jgi:predicted transposase YdaD